METDNVEMSEISGITFQGSLASDSGRSDFTSQIGFVSGTADKEITVYSGGASLFWGLGNNSPPMTAEVQPEDVRLQHEGQRLSTITFDAASVTAVQPEAIHIGGNPQAPRQSRFINPCAIATNHHALLVWTVTILLFGVCTFMLDREVSFDVNNQGMNNQEYKTNHSEIQPGKVRDCNSAWFFPDLPWGAPPSWTLLGYDIEVERLTCIQATASETKLPWRDDEYVAFIIAVIRRHVCLVPDIVFSRCHDSASLQKSAFKTLPLAPNYLCSTYLSK